MHQSVIDKLRYFTVSEPLTKAQRDAAIEVANVFDRAIVDLIDVTDGDSPMVTLGLQKLLEARQCFVNALL